MNGSNTVRLAREELAYYFGRMLPQGGAPDIALTVEEAPGPDRFSVRVDGAQGTISANRPRAVLLGVYDYLRRLGCRFLGPGRAGEVVPAVSPQALAADYSKTASFAHRGVCIEGADSLENILDFVDWLPKVGFNSFFLQFKTPYPFLERWYHHEENPLRAPEPYGMEDARRDMERIEAAVAERGLLLHKVGHGWTGEALGYETLGWRSGDTPLTEEARALTALVDGKRELWLDVPANTNLCLSSPAAVDRFASLVVDYARSNPGVDYLHIWLADAYNNVCECPQCRKTTPSDQYVALLNEIDRRLTAEGLPTRLVFLLYQELLWAPVKERLDNPDRFVLMFAPISRTFEYSYDLEEEPEDVPEYERNNITLPTDLGENLAFLRRWKDRFSGESFVFDYPLGRAHYGDLGYVGISRIISSDIKRLRAMGLDGYISCQELRAALPNALPNYVMGYTLFDESASVDSLIDEYFTAAYGEKARGVKTYLSELSRLSGPDYVNGKGPRTDPEVAARMAEAVSLCEVARPAGEGLWWRLLEYHRQYVLHLASALYRLARGETDMAGLRWLALRELLCRSEPEYQPWLDVYRVMEVTKKYTGFPVPDRSTQPAGAGRA